LLSAHFAQAQTDDARLPIGLGQLVSIAPVPSFSVASDSSATPSLELPVRHRCSSTCGWTFGVTPAWISPSDVNSSLSARLPNRSEVSGRINAAQFLSHDACEELIDESENGLVAAKILLERNHLASAGIILPVLDVTLENVGIGQTKAIDALPHVAYEESIRFDALSAQCAQNRVLSRVDVLVFIHKINRNLPRQCSANAVDGPCGIPESRRLNCSRS
jgi:hypothetical protein